MTKEMGSVVAVVLAVGGSENASVKELLRQIDTDDNNRSGQSSRDANGRRICKWSHYIMK